MCVCACMHACVHACMCTYIVVVKYFALAFERFLAPCFTELLMVSPPNLIS